MAKLKFKDRKIGRWLKEHAPEILEGISDDVPDFGILKIVARAIDNKHDSVIADDNDTGEFARKSYEGHALVDIELLNLTKPNHMNTVKDILASKKFLYAIAGILGMFITLALDISEEKATELVYGIIGIISTLIIGQGFADAGKEARKIQ